MQKIFSTPAPVALHVELGSGDLIVHTSVTDETVVEVDGKGAEDVVVEQRGEQILVLAKQRAGSLFGSSSRLTVQVTAPDDSRLSTKLGSADLSVRGRLGEANLKTGSGDIRIDVVAAAAHIESGSGDVSVDRVDGPVEVKSGSGDIAFETLGDAASVMTGSGDVLITTARGPVRVKSGSGDLRVREAFEDVALTTASGDLAVERMQRGQVAAKNVSGDIRVGVPTGVPVWTDISSVTGIVRSNLQGVGEPSEGQDFIELRATTVSGDILLEQI